VFTKALLDNADESCLLLPSNRGIPCYITVATVGVRITNLHMRKPRKKNLETQQMLELLLKEIRTIREKADADSKAWGEEMAAERRAIEARMATMRENMRNSHKEMVAET
jgi:hypothetical protein